MKKLVLLLVGLAVLISTPLVSAASPEYSADGQLILPKEYREWVFLSSGYATTYDNPGAANPNLFHNVFVNPASYRDFMKTGTWPDKTVMVLELRKSANKSSINREGQVQTGIAAIEVHVKDAAKGGWAFYGFRADAATGKPFPKTADCFSCHQQHGATDSTFVQFYPTLIDVAKAHHNFQESEK